MEYVLLAVQDQQKKKNSLINLVKHQSDIDKTDLSTKSLYEPKYQ